MPEIVTVSPAFPVMTIFTLLPRTEPLMAAVDEHVSTTILSDERVVPF